MSKFKRHRMSSSIFIKFRPSVNGVDVNKTPYTPTPNWLFLNQSKGVAIQGKSLHLAQVALAMSPHLLFTALKGSL